MGNGVRWEDMKVYKKNRDRIHSVITIYQQPADTVGRVLTGLLKRKMTFGEVNGSLDFNFIEKRLVRNFYNEICDQLDQVVGADVQKAA